MSAEQSNEVNNYSLFNFCEIDHFSRVVMERLKILTNLLLRSNFLKALYIKEFGTVDLIFFFNHAMLP